MLRHVNRSAPALHINEIDVNDKYQFLKQIGKGSYGEVWLVVPLRQSTSSKASSKQYVLKRLDLRQSSHDTTQGDIEAAEREAKLLSTLKHPNIVAYTESFRSNDGFLNIVMAYCEGGDLYTKLKERKTNKQPLIEQQIIEWFVQICMAIQVSVTGEESEVSNSGMVFSICTRKVFSIEIWRHRISSWRKMKSSKWAILASPAC